MIKIMNLRGVITISAIYLISVTWIWHYVMPLLAPELFDDVVNFFRYSDTLTYHRQAAELKYNLEKNGLSEWGFSYKGNAPSSILALIYFVTKSSNPLLYIPLSILLYLSSVILVYAILEKITDEFLAASGSILFAASPVATIVYAEVGKDVWTIFAFLLLLYCVVSRRKIYALIFLTGVSCLILLWMRPYLLYVANAAFFFALLWLLLQAILSHRKIGVDVVLRSAIRLGALWGVVFGVTVANLFASVSSENADANSAILIDSVNAHLITSAGSKNVDANSAILIDSVNAHPITSAGSNFGMDFIASIIDGARSRLNTFDGSTKVDSDVKFINILDVLIYAPKAVGIGLAAPFFIDYEALSGRAEISMHFVWLFYNAVGLLLLFGIIFLIKEPNVLVIFLLSFVFIVSLAFVCSNLGTFLRMRIGYLEFCMCLGLSGWMKYFFRHNRPHVNYS